MLQEAFTYEARPETRWGLTLFMFLWTGIALGMVGVLGFGLLTDPPSAIDLYLVWLCVAAAATLGLNYLSWQLRGREVLTLTPGKLQFHITGTLFRRTVVLPFDIIEDISHDDDADTPYWIKHWGIGGGRVVVTYLGRRKRYGQDLGTREAARLVTRLRAAVADAGHLGSEHGA